MPKRAFPFDKYSFTPQFKSHASEKDVFSTSEKFLDCVHAKTLEKLYKGARTTNNQRLISDCPHKPSEAPEKHYRQLTLGKYGQLLSTPNNPEVGAAINKLEVIEIRRCSFCEISLSCQQCMKECNNCQAAFCQQCCINVPTSGSEDMTLCFSCVR